MQAPGGLPAIGEEIAGKYRIESVLGQGGMGAVFSAQNTLTGKRVAIKWLLPEQASETSRERLLREARIAASIEHPNVVDIFDIGEHDGGLFLVMEYLRGLTLGDMLAERGRLDPVELIALLIPIMRGVHFAHQCGIVHRDLKPENIILSEVDGQIVPKILDFGVSKAISGNNIPHSTLTRTGALIGTPHYMALEQVDGSGAVDGRTDVYAFGVIIYRALTGHYPFDGSSLGEVILKIGTKDPQPMRLLRPEITPDLDAVVLRAITRPRHERYASVEEFARALEPFAPGVRFRESGETTHRMSVSSSSRYLGPVEYAPPTAFELSQPGLLRAPAAPTPVPGRMRTRAFMVGATLAMLLVVAALAFMFQPPQPSVVPVAMRTAATAPVIEAKSAPSSARALDVQAIEPVVEAKVEPSSLSPPALVLQPLDPVDVERAVATVTAPTPETAPMAPKPGSAASPSRNKRSPKANRDNGPKVVPGDRTKGLSVDDF